jgi:hypothetical protein
MKRDDSLREFGRPVRFFDRFLAANKEDPTYANRIHALFQTPETANIWKQADCTISGPLKDEATGLADTTATATATGLRG